MSSKNSPSLTSLRAFSVAGHCLSVTGAAQQLGVTQSAVSRQIKALEDTLEFKLFDRIGNSINLTAKGQAFHRKVFTIFGLLEDATNDATLFDYTAGIDTEETDNKENGKAIQEEEPWLPEEHNITPPIDEI